MTKENSILVKESEIKEILVIFSKYEKLIQANTLQHEKELAFIEYFYLKYEQLVSLRKEQKKWYDTLKSLDDETFTKGTKKSEIEEMKRDVAEFYYSAKSKREELQSYIEKLELEFYSN